MTTRTWSASLSGIQCRPILIEAATYASIPKIQITGLPGDTVKESKERVRASLINLGFDVPSRFVLVHLSPASQKKLGSQLDLGIAISILMAEKGIHIPNSDTVAFLGEVKLDGSVGRIDHAINLVHCLDTQNQIKLIFLSSQNHWEAQLAQSGKVRLVSHLSEILNYFKSDTSVSWPVETSLTDEDPLPHYSHTLDSLEGLPLGKRAIQLALAGGHHCLFFGPPGSGKSFLCSASPSLMPPLAAEELIECLKIYEMAQTSKSPLRVRPFRAPHHSVSRAGLLGGGSGCIAPGEVSLAHNGVLFLDELAEFSRDCLEGLREPLETGHIQIHRTGEGQRMLARFILLGALNPCPCGYSLGGNRRCTCPKDKILNYRKKISGPLIDRFDLGLFLQTQTENILTTKKHTQYQSEIERAREVQHNYYKNHLLNAHVSVSQFPERFALNERIRKLWESICKQKGLSFRKKIKLLKISRTLADLSESDNFQEEHLLEASLFLCPDLESFPTCS